VSTEISWIFEATVKPDALDEYGALAREISADNQAAEPGQQIFEWFIGGQDVHIYERYQDSAAALAHVQRFVENFASRFLSLCTPTRMSVYGEPSAELTGVKGGADRFQPVLPGAAGRPRQELVSDCLIRAGKPAGHSARLTADGAGRLRLALSQEPSVTRPRPARR